MAYFKFSKVGANEKEGVTLIEIIVVLIIVGILAAIALPSYYSWIMRSKAAEGALILKNYADSAEGYLITHNCNITSTSLPLPYSPNFVWGSFSSGSGGSSCTYMISIAINSDVGVSSNISCPFGGSFPMPANSIALCRNTDGSRKLIGTGVFEGMF
ncbi:MAG: prepilin-type N-terminal cleavage/methylation domain-containing protein [Candidatus Omnitrophica bacterium]|nr:prepilin-type N-terminal cleavage/methylation domain-containing protein [Candidatus Omnitrophota bacterium]